MVLLEFSMLMFPPQYHGKWRLYNVAEFKDDGVVKKECSRIRFDVREF